MFLLDEISKLANLFARANGHPNPDEYALQVRNLAAQDERDAIPVPDAVPEKDWATDLQHPAVQAVEAPVAILPTPEDAPEGFAALVKAEDAVNAAEAAAPAVGADDLNKE